MKWTYFFAAALFLIGLEVLTSTFAYSAPLSASVGSVGRPVEIEEVQGRKGHRRASDSKSLRLKMRRFTQSLRRFSARGNSRRVQKVSKRIARLRGRLKSASPGQVGIFSSICTDANSSLLIEVENQTPLSVRLLIRARPDSNENPVLNVGEVPPGNSNRLLVANEQLIYGRETVEFEPLFNGEKLDSEVVVPFSRSLRVNLPRGENCTRAVAYTLTTSDFGPDSINVPGHGSGEEATELQNGEVIEFACPETLILSDKKEARLDSHSSTAPDQNGVASELCYYTWNPTPSTIISGPLVEVRYAIDQRYAAEFDFPMGCQRKFSDTLFFSSSRQFFLRIPDLVFGAERFSVAAKLLNQFERAGASCPF